MPDRTGSGARQHGAKAYGRGARHWAEHLAGKRHFGLVLTRFQFALGPKRLVCAVEVIYRTGAATLYIPRVPQWEAHSELLQRGALFDEGPEPEPHRPI